MFQGEHSALLLTFIKLPFIVKIFVLSIFELPFYTGFTVHAYNCNAAGLQDKNREECSTKIFSLTRVEKNGLQDHQAQRL